MRVSKTLRCCGDHGSRLIDRRSRALAANCLGNGGIALQPQLFAPRATLLRDIRVPRGSCALAANRLGRADIAVWPPSFAPGATLLRGIRVPRRSRADIAVWPPSFAPGATLLQERRNLADGRCSCLNQSPTPWLSGNSRSIKRSAVGWGSWLARPARSLASMNTCSG